MWICPKCGREFKRTNQDHYCGKPPETVEEYIQSQPQEAQAHLAELRRIICRSIPGIRERIAWSMPMFEKNRHSISFAACKNYVSLYVGMEVLDAFKEQFSEFVIKKNAVYLPYEKALPVELIEKIAMQCFETQ